MNWTNKANGREPMRPGHPTGKTVALIECHDPEAKELKKMKLKNKFTWMIMVFFAFSLSHWLGIVSAKEPSNRNS